MANKDIIRNTNMKESSILVFIARSCHLFVSDRMCDYKSKLKMKEEEMEENFDEDPLADAVLGMGKLNYFIQECNEQEVLALQKGDCAFFIF